MSKGLPIDLEIKCPTLDEIKKRLGDFSSKSPSVLRSVISQTLTRIKKEFLKESVQAVYAVDDSRFKKGKSFYLTAIRPRASNLTGVLKVTGYNIALSKYKMSPEEPQNQKKQKYSERITPKAKVLKSSVMKTISKCFIAKTKSGHIGIFERNGANQRSKITGNYKILQKFGPSIPSILRNEKVQELLNIDIKKSYEHIVIKKLHELATKGK